MKHFKLQLKDRVYEVSLQPLFTVLGWTFAILKASKKK